MRGRLLAELGRDDEAAADFNKVVELRSAGGTNTQNMQRQLGHELARDQEWDSATVVFHGLYKDSPEDPGHWQS